MRTCITIIACFLFFHATAQTWSNRYFTVPLSQVVKCYDYNSAYGGLLCLARDYSFTPDYFLVRINNRGDTLWTKYDCLNIAPGLSAIPYAIAQLTNGDFMVATCQIATDNSDAESAFFRIDSNGNITHTLVRGADYDYGVDMSVMGAANDGYYISYSWDSFYQSIDGLTGYVNAESVIEKHDSNNVLLWTKLFPTILVTTGMTSWEQAYPWIQISIERTVDDGVIYFRGNTMGRVNPDGTDGYASTITDLFPQYDGGNFGMNYMFSTSDTGFVNVISDTVGHFCKFNSRGELQHELTTDGVSYGTELSNGTFLMARTTAMGFFRYDRNLNFLDSATMPFSENNYIQTPVIHNNCGGAFCAYPIATSDPHIFAINFDSLYNIHKDLKVTMHGNCLVPGFISHIRASLFNAGTVAADTTLVVILDSNTSFVSSMPSPLSISGDTLVFSIDSLLPGDTDSIAINARVDSTAGLGVELSFAAYSGYQNTINPSDDTATFRAATVSSFDPNSKTVNRTFYFTADRNMTYAISFENTGNHPAAIIIVTDTLDKDLDTSTFQMIGSSPVTPTVSWVASNVVTFAFANVDLPDSASSPDESVGQVSYSVAVTPAAAMGDTIRNSASIVFDYNAPVKTNTTMNIISNVNAADTLPVITSTIPLIYPNPFTDHITVQLPSPADSYKISLFDMEGRLVFSKIYATSSAVLPLNLPCGTYEIRLLNLRTNQTVKKKMARIPK